MVTVAKVGLGCPLGRSDRPRELMGTGSPGTGWRRVGGGSRKGAPVCTSPSVTPEQPTSPDGRPSPSGNNAVPPAWTRPALGGCWGPPAAWSDGWRGRARGDGAGSREGSASGQQMSCLLNNSEGADGWWPPTPIALSALRTGVSFHQRFLTRLSPSHSFLVGESAVPTSPRARCPPGVAAGKPTCRGPQVPPASPPRTVALPQGGGTRLPVSRQLQTRKVVVEHPGGAATQSPGVLSLWGASVPWVPLRVPTHLILGDVLGVLSPIGAGPKSLRLPGPRASITTGVLVPQVSMVP